MEVGFAVTVAPVVPESDVDGDQIYVVAPDAVRVTDAPLHRFGFIGVMVTMGSVSTIRLTVSAFVQCIVSVAVTVYDVVTVGLT